MAQKPPQGCNGENCTFESHRNQSHLLYHVKCKIPTKIKYSELHLLPHRSDFTDPKLRAVFSAQVGRGGPLIFLPNDIIEKNDRVDGRLKYRIYMVGILPCGSRALVILEGVEVHFDVMVPDGMTSRAFDDFLRGQLNTKNIPYNGIKDVHALRLKGFQKAPRVWKRLSFDTLQERKRAIEFVEALNREYATAGKPKLETAADDNKRGASDFYFPKVAREMRFATADWNRIEKYTSVRAGDYSPNCDYVLKVNIADLKKLNRAKRDELKAPAHPLKEVIDRDNTMVAQWDIETWRKIQNGMVPTPKDEDYVIFMVCSSYFWHHSAEPLVSVCAVHTSTGLRAGMSIAVECETEREVLITHYTAMGKMSPDILAAFNGQSFDWPLYREKLRRENLLVEMKKNLSAVNVLPSETEANVLKWCFTSTKIKIDAETKHHAECILKIPGIIDIDVLPIFLKLYPKMEVRKSFSLNFFLAKNGLESKEDMHFKVMFKIYERARKLSERAPAYRECHCMEFAEAQHTGTPWKAHCACADKIPEIDCKRNPDYKEGGKEPEYTGDWHDDLIADGSDVSAVTPPILKCCNCGKAPRNIDGMRDVSYYCTIDTVRPQQLCVKRAIVPDKRELSTMSYVSNYDSYFRADGMKVRNLIGSYSHRRGIAFSNSGSGKTEDEKDHYPGAWVFPPERGLHARRPITGLDFASLYPSLMMTYNLSPDMVVYDKATADALAAEGYSIHHIKPFQFERGKEKGAAENKHLTIEGWTVRHNGVFNPKKNSHIVAEYVKTVVYAYKVTAGHNLFARTLHEILENALVLYPISPDSALTDKSIDESTRELYIEITVRAGIENYTPAQEKVTQYLQSQGLKPARRVKYIPAEGRKQLPGERMGIFAFIVKKLFDKRVPIKGEFVRLSKLLEQMELAKTKVWAYKDAKGNEVTTTMSEVKFQIAKVDSKQKALKVLANTFYGESGNYLSSIYELLVAAGITCAGQENIKKVADFIRGKGFGPRYGDSVTQDTPIIVQFPSGDIGYRTVDNFTLGDTELQWQQYGPILPDGTVKECAKTDLRAWTETGWTRIVRVIRHKTKKDIYRVSTNSGTVDVTADHSLLSPEGYKLFPSDVDVGALLLHADLPRGNFIPSGDPKCAAAEEFYTSGRAKCTGEIILLINRGPTSQYVYDLETENHHFSAGVGCIIVHNTDSIYTTCPESVYAESDKKYYAAVTMLEGKHDGVRNTPTPETEEEKAYHRDRAAARKEYWTEMVAITMKVMNAVKEEVSDFLLSDNGTCFLNMAYEEVGFPTVLCGKKKYFLTPHIETINFYPKDVFIRGIDIIKQGQTQISKKLGDEFMREALSPENERELIDIAVDKIRKFYSMNLESTMFALSAKYNPTKKNVPVITFVNRMKEIQKRYLLGAAPDPAMYALYEPPEPGDKFMYVVVKKEQNFTMQGRRIEIKKGDQMEFLRVYNESQKSPKFVPMEIDLNYYVKNAIVGIFARFIAYHPRFQPPADMYDLQDKVQYRAMDEFCVKAASKYLEELCDSITGHDPKALTVRGREYQKIYKSADKSLQQDLVQRYGTAANILRDVDVHDTAEDLRSRSTRIIAQIKERAAEDVEDLCSVADTTDNYIAAAKKIGFSAFKLKRVYMTGKTKGLATTLMSGYKRREEEIIAKLYKVLGSTSRIIYNYEQRFNQLIDELRTGGVVDATEDQISRVNTLDEESAQNIESVRSLSTELTSVLLLQERLKRVINRIELDRMKAINEPMDPRVNAKEVSCEDSKSAAPVDEYQWG